MKTVRNLYRRRAMYTVLGVLSLITPLPGIGVGLFIQAKCVDNDIKNIALNNENK